MRCEKTDTSYSAIISFACGLMLAKSVHTAYVFSYVSVVRKAVTYRCWPVTPTSKNQWLEGTYAEPPPGLWQEKINELRVVSWDIAFRGPEAAKW
jgi:hypothetical protein